MNMFKKRKCKRMGHIFQPHHIEADGFGNEWHWKKCSRCGFSTFDIKEATHE